MQKSSGPIYWEWTLLNWIICKCKLRSNTKKKVCFTGIFLRLVQFESLPYIDSSSGWKLSGVNCVLAERLKGRPSPAPQIRPRVHNPFRLTARPSDWTEHAALRSLLTPPLSVSGHFPSPPLETWLIYRGVKDGLYSVLFFCKHSDSGRLCGCHLLVTCVKFNCKTHRRERESEYVADAKFAWLSTHQRANSRSRCFVFALH